MNTLCNLRIPLNTHPILLIHVALAARIQDMLHMHARKLN